MLHSVSQAEAKVYKNKKIKSVACRIIQSGSFGSKDVVLLKSDKRLTQNKDWIGHFFYASPQPIHIYTKTDSGTLQEGHVGFSFVLDMKKKSVAMNWDMNESENKIAVALDDYTEAPLAKGFEYRSQAYGGDLSKNILDARGKPIQNLEARCKVI